MSQLISVIGGVFVIQLTLAKSNFQKFPAQPHLSPNYSSTTNTFPRRYRRSHRVGLPDLDETVDAKDQEGSCDHQDKAFNLKLSSFVQCWKCESASFDTLL